MYGVDESLMKRIERRMKEKIYREMIEQEQKAKRNPKQDKSSRQFAQSRFKTSPSYNDSEREPNKYQSSHIINESATFLPVINKRQDFESDGEGERRMNPQNKKRQNSRSRRRNRPQRTTERRFSSANGSFGNQKPFKTLGDDSEQQKTEQYLNQCEQIISNLRELTRKNKDKNNQRENRSGYSNDFSYPPQNKSFRGNEFATNSNSYTPKHDFSKQSPLQFHNPLKKSIFNNNSWESSSRPNSYSLSNDAKKESSFEFQKQRPNFRRISPPRVRIDDLKQKSGKNTKDKNRYQNSQQDEPQQEAEQTLEKKEKNKKKQGKPSKKELEKPKSNIGKQNFRRLSPIRREQQQRYQNKEDELAKEKEKDSKKDVIEELMKENQRQKAIVKYLKKARLRGNQLKKKVQSRKGNEEQEKPVQDGGQDPNQNDPNNPNSKQNNPNDPNKPNNPNDPKENPPGNPNAPNGQLNKSK